MRILKCLLLLLVAVIGVSFAWLNPDTVNFHYYFGTAEIRLAWLLVLFLTAGWVLGLLTILRSALALRARLFQAERKIRLTERSKGG